METKALKNLMKITLSYRLDTYIFASARAYAEGHLSIFFSKEGIVLAATNIFAGMEFCAPLTNNDVAGADFFSAIFFYTQSFRNRIATVLC